MYIYIIQYVNSKIIQNSGYLVIAFLEQPAAIWDLEHCSIWDLTHCSRIQIQMKGVFA